LSFPADTYVEFSGTAEAQAQSRRDLLVNSLLAALGIVLLLSVVTGNYRNLLLVLLNLPLALVGGVLVALLTGGNLSLGSLVDFVTLFGITLRNSIMLISHYEHLFEGEGMTWGIGHCSPWRFRTPRANFNDSFGHGTRSSTPGDWQRRPGTRNLRADGHGDSWRTRDLDFARPSCSTYARFALRQIRAQTP
jgi:hypothetical protein